MRMSREQWIWTVLSALMKESAYSNANAPSDVHLFSCEMEPKQNAYRRDLIEQTRPLQTKRYTKGLNFRELCRSYRTGLGGWPGDDLVNRAIRLSTGTNLNRKSSS